MHRRASSSGGPVAREKAIGAGGDLLEVLRLALVAQWLRAARSHRSGRQTALRYAAGVTAVQIGWLLRLLVPERWYVVTFLVLAVAGHSRISGPLVFTLVEDQPLLSNTTLVMRYQNLLGQRYLSLVQPAAHADVRRPARGALLDLLHYLAGTLQAGAVAVFAGAANTPLACTIMGVEMFGAGATVPDGGVTGGSPRRRW